MGLTNVWGRRTPLRTKTIESECLISNDADIVPKRRTTGDVAKLVSILGNICLFIVSIVILWISQRQRTSGSQELGMNALLKQTSSYCK
jgi:hypothetical protein